jgi:hypothetical protein
MLGPVGIEALPTLPCKYVRLFALWTAEHAPGLFPRVGFEDPAIAPHRTAAKMIW